MEEVPPEGKGGPAREDDGICDLFLKTEASKSYAGFTFQTVFAVLCVWRGILGQPYEWIYPYLIDETLRSLLIREVVVEGRDDVELQLGPHDRDFLKKDPQVLVQLKHDHQKKKGGGSTGDLKHTFMIAAFQLMRSRPDDIFELRTKQELVGDGIEWSEAQSSNGIPKLLLSFASPERRSPDRKKRARLNARQQNVENDKDLKVRREKALTSEQTSAISDWLGVSENRTMVAKHVFGCRIGGYDDLVVRATDYASIFIRRVLESQGKYLNDQIFNIVRDAALSFLWYTASTCTIAAYCGVDGKRGSFEAARLRTLNFSKCREELTAKVNSLLALGLAALEAECEDGLKRLHYAKMSSPLAVLG
jgi:hypothetical protein